MSWIDLLHTCHQKSVPFFSYRLPSSAQLVVGVQRSSSVEVVADFEALDLNRNGFLVAPFLFGEGRSAYFINEDFKVEDGSVPEALINYLSNLPSQSFPKRGASSSMTKVDYESRVNRLIEAIRQGVADKVVFSRNIVTPLMDGFDWAVAYQKMQSQCPSAFVYCFYIPDKGLWMGATPELLLRKENKLVETVALAGTMSNVVASWSSKNSEEQAMVVRYVENVLQSFEVQNLQKRGPISITAGNVCHLKTHFTAHLKDEAKALPLLAALHPTPAVCGFPRESALTLIKREELVDRDFYAGFLGALSNRDFAFYVNLRCMRLGAEDAELFVGGGIMKDSDAEDEWNETILKSKTMGHFVGLN